MSAISFSYCRWADDDYWLHGYARKIPTKKANLKTLFDLCNQLWSTFMQYPKTTLTLVSSLICTMIKASEVLSVVDEQICQAYSPAWSKLTNGFLLKWKSFGLFQKTKYHSNNFSFGGYRQTAVIIKLSTLEDPTGKMKTCAYWLLKMNLKKNLSSDASMKRLMMQLCFIWAMVLKLANLKVLPLLFQIQMFLFALYTIMENVCILP